MLIYPNLILRADPDECVGSVLRCPRNGKTRVFGMKLDP